MSSTAPVTNRRPQHPWEYRHLIWSFAQRDLKARYKGTALGWTWSLVVPLATVLTYTIVFSVIFRAAPPDFGNGRVGNFTVWFICGLVPWSFFYATVSYGIPSLVAAGPLLQKIYIPSFVPVLGAATGTLVQTLIEFGLVLVILAAFGSIGWTWLLVPLWLALFIVLSCSIAYTLAILNVFFRDVSQLVAVALQLLFFATPILYPIDQVPEVVGPIPLRQLILLNPMAEAILGFRSLLYGLEVIPWRSVLYVLAWTVGSLLVARAVYRWRGRDIGEEI